jgi:hypothetical protein
MKKPPEMNLLLMEDTDDEEENTLYKDLLLMEDTDDEEDNTLDQDLLSMEDPHEQDSIENEDEMTEDESMMNGYSSTYDDRLEECTVPSSLEGFTSTVVEFLGRESDKEIRRAARKAGQVARKLKTRERRARQRFKTAVARLEKEEKGKPERIAQVKRKMIPLAKSGFKHHAETEELNDNFVLGFDLAELPRNSKGGVKVKFIVPRNLVGCKNKSSQQKRRMVQVCPQKVEKAFRTSFSYVGRYGANPRGEEALKDSRQRFVSCLKFIQTGKPLLVSCANLESDGSVRFTDGKHRFCAYRELDLRAVPLLVPVDQAKLFERRFCGSQRQKQRRVRKVAPNQAGFDRGASMF